MAPPRTEDSFVFGIKYQFYVSFLAGILVIFTPFANGQLDIFLFLTVDADVSCLFLFCFCCAVFWFLRTPCSCPLHQHWEHFVLILHFTIPQNDHPVWNFSVIINPWASFLFLNVVSCFYYCRRFWMFWLQTCFISRNFHLESFICFFWCINFHLLWKHSTCGSRWNCRKSYSMIFGDLVDNNKAVVFTMNSQSIPW